MKKNVFLAVTLLAFIAVGAFAQSESDFKVTKTGTEVTIIGYTGSATVVNIPATIQNLPVTTIGRAAFANNTKITSVIMPNRVETIEDSAFLGCTALTSVTIGNNVWKMGAFVFAYCDSLTSVTFIGDKLQFPQRIDSEAFNRLGDLREKLIKGGYGTFTRPNRGEGGTWTKQATPAATVAPPAQNESDFTVTKTGNAITITGYTGKATVVNIPATIQNLPVTIIGERSFYGKADITSLTIPDSVTTIERAAFCGCGFTSVTIGSGVKKIGDNAFNPCNNLDSVTFRGTIPSSGFSSDGTFLGHNTLRQFFYATDKNNGTPGTYTRSGQKWTKK